MMRRQRVALASALGLGGLGLLMLLLRAGLASDDAPLPATGPPGDALAHLARGDPASRESGEASPARELVPPSKAALVLRITDTDSRPIAGARVLLAPRTRHVEPTGMVELGKSSRAGIARIRAELLQDGRARGALISIQHPDYIAGGLEPATALRALEQGSESRIVLERSQSQEFRFTTEQGGGVQDVVVWLSCYPLPDLSRDKRDWSAGPDRDAIVAAQSDADGRISVQGLRPGSWHLAISTPLPYVIARWPQPRMQSIVAPSPPLCFVLDRLWGCAVVVEGDRATTFRAKYNQVKLEGLGRCDIESVTNDLKGKWATNLMGFGLPASRFDEPSIEWEILLERTGWRKLLVPLRRLDERFAPTVCAVPADAPAVPTGTLVLERSQETPWHPSVDLSLEESGSPFGSRGLFMRVEPGSYHLPAGAYRLRSVRDKVLHRVLSSAEIVVRAGETTEWKLDVPEDIAMVLVGVNYPSGNPACHIGADFAVGGRVVAERVLSDARGGPMAVGVPVYLPVGDVVVTLCDHRSGKDLLTETLRIARGSSPQSVTLGVDW